MRLRIQKLLCLVALAFTQFACTAAGAAAQAEVTAQRPNIILMMTDDMGWGSFDFPVRLGQTAQGQPVMYPGTKLWQTPNLRAMAEGGLVFSRMYSQSPVCSPTRGSVLTGRAPQRIGIPSANRGSIQNREVTAAEYAQALGYRTGHFGKWHLGVFTRDLLDANRGGKPNSHSIYSTPLNNGYDVQYATESKTSTYDPGTSGLTRATRYWTGPGAFIPLEDPQLKGDDSAIIARQANAFMQDAVKRGQPFLAVVWFHTPHKPLNTPGNTDVDNLPAFRFAMQDLDAAVGAIRAQVRALGVADNTILFFTSDNGPEDDQDYCEDPLRANKRELYEGGVRVPGLVEWPGRIAPGQTHSPMVTTDYLPTLMEIWDIDPIDDRPMDGQSMAELLFNDRATVRERTITFKSTNGQQSAVGIDGRYKLISTNKGKTWSLYDLLIDYDENDALATSQTIESKDQATQAIYNTLLTDYNAWAESVQHSLSDKITGDYATRIKASTGVIIQAEPPHKLTSGQVSDTAPHLYLERQHATLRSDLTLNITTENKLAKGTVVNSYLLHLNPPSAEDESIIEITFDDPVLGVIMDAQSLHASDSLSFADPVFEAGLSRGLEGNDHWSIAEDGKTVRFTLTAQANALDQARILTRSTLSDLAENQGDQP